MLPSNLLSLPWRWSLEAPPRCRYTSTKLYCITSPRGNTYYTYRAWKWHSERVFGLTSPGNRQNCDFQSLRIWTPRQIYTEFCGQNYKNKYNLFTWITASWSYVESTWEADRKPANQEAPALTGAETSITFIYRLNQQMHYLYRCSNTYCYSSATRFPHLCDHHNDVALTPWWWSDKRQKHVAKEY
jgi:hypothetical protein